MLQKIAAIIALLIGLMSVIAGSKVLFGIESKEYNILLWLVSYNVIMGIASILTAILIWKNKEIFKSFAIFILIAHFTVFIYLKLISATAASESINAMIFRTGIWLAIVLLTRIIPKYISKK